MVSFEDLEADCYTTRSVTALEDEQGPRTRSRTQGCGTSGRNPSRRRDSGVGSGESQGAGIRCAGCHQGAVLERECEDCVNMEGSHSLQEDQGDVEKNADQQGLIRGVKQSNVEGHGGAHYWQRDMTLAQRELQGPASTMAGVHRTCYRARQRLLRGFAALVVWWKRPVVVKVKEVSPFRAWCSVLTSMLLLRNLRCCQRVCRPDGLPYQWWSLLRRACGLTMRSFAVFRNGHGQGPRDCVRDMLHQPCSF
jgi:hypothetical protein